MNAAAKQISQYHIFDGALNKMHVSKQSYVPLGLLILVLLSALVVIYTTNLQRMLCGQLETLKQQAHQLELQWGQLLLEQASLETPERVQQFATEQLHMILPTDKQMYILRVHSQ